MLLWSVLLVSLPLGFHLVGLRAGPKARGWALPAIFPFLLRISMNSEAALWCRLYPSPEGKQGQSPHPEDGAGWPRSVWLRNVGHVDKRALMLFVLLPTPVLKDGSSHPEPQALTEAHCGLGQWGTDTSRSDAGAIR